MCDLFVNNLMNINRLDYGAEEGFRIKGTEGAIVEDEDQR